MNGLGVLLVDAGIAAVFLGLVSLVRPLRFLGIRSRRRAAVLIGIGVLLGLAGAMLPAPVQRATGEPVLLDDFVPVYESQEFHELRVQATPERVYDAVLNVTAEEIRLFRTLTRLRSPRRNSRPESILNPSARTPILEVATSGGFLKLAEDPGREIVLGTLVIAPPEARSYRGSFTPRMFAELERPGFAKAAINFRVKDEGGGWSRVTTETRVHATDSWTRRRFAAYWRTIYPGSALIRVMWLRAIRDRAQGRL